MNNYFTLPKDVDLILEKLNSVGEGYIVGGCVRDILLDVEPKDYDFTTNLLPNQIKELFKNYTTILTGEEYGTVTIVINGEAFEITTFRIDGNYSDNRRPDSVNFVTSLREDLARRDFTINSLAYNHTVGLVDYFGGVEDLRNGIIRCVGNPADRINDDALRMLRAVRFAARYGFTIESKTLLAIEEKAPSIKNVSAERIQSELNKILVYNPNHVYGLFLLFILKEILPEVYDCFYCQQDNPYHSETVGQHLLSVMRNTPTVLHIRLAALLHDIGKPFTKTVDPVTGTDHFYDHQNKSNELAKDILKRLKYDNETTEKVLSLVLHHMDTIIPSKRVLRRLLNTLGKELTNDLFDLHKADILAHTVVEQRLEELQSAEKMLDEIIANQECFSLKDLSVSGKDLIDLGLKPGKQFGVILNNLLEKVIENPELNTKEQLLKEIENEI